MSFSFLDEPCILCGWYDSDFGCTCSPLEKWYQCPLEPEPDWDAILKESYEGGET